MQVSNSINLQQRNSTCWSLSTWSFWFGKSTWEGLYLYQYFAKFVEINLMGNTTVYFVVMVVLAFSSAVFEKKFLILASLAGAIVQWTKPDEIGVHLVAWIVALKPKWTQMLFKKKEAHEKKCDPETQIRIVYLLKVKIIIKKFQKSLHQNLLQNHQNWKKVT